MNASQHRTTRWRIAVAAVLLGAVGLFVACTESPTPATPLRPSAPSSSYTFTGSCGASYTLLTYESDSLMSQYGIPPTQDTLAVCETWVGNDYTTQIAVAGSSENQIAMPDTVQGMSYSGGSMVSRAADGTQVGGTTGVGGPTLFDFMLADASQVQASYDNPYYGLYAPGGGGGGGGDGCAPTVIICQPAMMSVAPIAPIAPIAPSEGPDALSASRAALDIAASPDTSKFHKHGLHRAGTRALVDDMTEISASPEGHRRFRKIRNGDEVIVSIDPATELLTGEETHGTGGRILRAKHSWKRVAGGYYRTRTDVEDEELVHDKRFVNHSTIQIKGLRINGVEIDPGNGGAP
jgi:hypothetical protein